MLLRVKLFGSIAAVGLVAACAQPAPPVPIQPQPIYNKLGGIVGCEDGWVLNPNTQQLENPCVPPEEDCDPQTSPTVGAVPCYPPAQRGGGSGQTTAVRGGPKDV